MIWGQDATFVKMIRLILRVLQKWLAFGADRQASPYGMLQLPLFNWVCQSYTQRQYQQAQHKTQSKRKTGNWKIDCERRREEHKTLLSFPFPKSLNYYWLLLFYFNIVHSLWTNNIKHKEHLGLACAHNTFTGILSEVGANLLSLIVKTDGR